MTTWASALTRQPFIFIHLADNFYVDFASRLVVSVLGLHH